MFNFQERQSFQCGECPKSFSSAVVLRNHMRSHMGRSHLCPVCSEGFSSTILLRKHMSTHTPAKNYTCAFCKEEFKNAAQLRRHQKDCQGMCVGPLY